MEKMKAVSKSAFGASVFAIVLLLFFASVACFSSIGLVREIMLWMAVAVTPIAMAAGVISGYAKEHADVLGRIAALRNDVGICNEVLRLPDDELGQQIRNRWVIIMDIEDSKHEIEMRQRRIEDIRRDIEKERQSLLDKLESDLRIRKPVLVAWWEKYILLQTKIAY